LRLRTVDRGSLVIATGMSGITHSNLLIAAQLYGTQGPAAKARRETAPPQDFAAELAERPKDRRPVNPTLQAPGAPKPLEPAKRFDEGAGRRDAMPPAKSETQIEPERMARPGSRLDIRV
jgi:hypothetical protein